MKKRELFKMTQKNLIAKKSISLTRQRRGASWKSDFLRIRKGKHFPLIKFFFFSLIKIEFSFTYFSYVHQISENKKNGFRNLFF